jgi:hypothetical protein
LSNYRFSTNRKNNKDSTRTKPTNKQKHKSFKMKCKNSFLKISMDGDGMDWIVLAQDRDQWRALVNTMMNLRVP